MKAITLARVSTLEQKTDGQSITAQNERVTDYVDRKGFELWQSYEFDESASKKNRKKFDEIIQVVKKTRETIALVVDTVDRFQRSYRESVTFDEFRKDGKVELHFLRENLVIHRDSNSADIQRWDMAVLFAKSYVMTISDNVKRTFELMRAKGEITGPPPIGYMSQYEKVLDHRGKVRQKRVDITFDPQTAPRVKHLFILFETGNYSIKTLCTEAEKLGLRGTQLGKPLSNSMIAKILNDPFYCGFAYSRKYKVKYPHRYHTLISEETFYNCQNILAGRRVERKTYATKEFIFKGLLRCGSCKGAITGDVKKGKHVYYSCSGYKGCKKVTVAEKKLLEPIYDILDNLQKPESWIEDVVELMKKSQDSKNTFQLEQNAIARKRYAQIQVCIERLPKMFLEGRITEEQYDRLLLEYKNEQLECNVDMTMHTHADKEFFITVKNVLSLSQRARSIFESSKVDEKRALLSLLLSNSVLNGKKPLFKLREPFNYLYELGRHPTGLPRLDEFRNLGWEKADNDIELYRRNRAV